MTPLRTFVQTVEVHNTTSKLSGTSYRPPPIDLWLHPTGTANFLTIIESEEDDNYDTKERHDSSGTSQTTTFSIQSEKARILILP